MISITHIADSIPHRSTVDASLSKMELLGDFKSESFGLYLFVFGIGTLAAGVLLMLHHKRSLEETERTVSDQRLLLFERRKFRRRTIASSMIAAIGVTITSLSWATEPAIFAALVLLVLSLVIGLLCLATIDLIAVGLQSIANPDNSARDKMVQEFLRHREQQQNSNGSNSDH